MKTSYQMAVELHEAIGQGHPNVPTQASDHVRGRRLTLLLEEVAELACALYGVKAEEYADGLARLMLNVTMFHVDRAGIGPADLSHVAKEAIDVHVVVSGTCAEYGIPEDKVYEVVHASNMAKAGGPQREDGKQLKPEGWKPPDVAGVIARAADPLADARWSMRHGGAYPDPATGL
jgi:predicted HAD superfamily Cof-like phosphohydrolase